MKKTVRRSARSKRTKQTNNITAGYDLADIFVKRWNAQPNPPKVYVRGYRIHHGLVGLGLAALGVIGLFASTRSDNKQTRDIVVNASGLAIGAGIRLMEDDIDDMPDWFNFEKKSSMPQPILQENYLLPSQISQNNPALSYPYINPKEFV